MEFKQNKTIRIGSRDSQLAVVQTNLIIDAIKREHSDIAVQLLTMKTTGDLILDRSLDKIGGKGLFVKELDNALLGYKTDLSVHSLKDMPMEILENMPIVAYSKREDPRDVLVLQKGVVQLPKHPILGSSSKRRVLQLEKLFEGATFNTIRGNVLTRLAKLDEGLYDGLILAAAGLKRLGLEDRISRYFTPDEIIPAAGQGILAIQGREGEDYSYLHQIHSEETKAIATAERAFIGLLNGGCSSPMAAYAVLENGRLKLRGLFYNESKGTYITGEAYGTLEEATDLGVGLAKELKERL